MFLYGLYDYFHEVSAFGGRICFLRDLFRKLTLSRWMANFAVATVGANADGGRVASSNGSAGTLRLTTRLRTGSSSLGGAAYSRDHLYVVSVTRAVYGSYHGYGSVLGEASGLSSGRIEAYVRARCFAIGYKLRMLYYLFYLYASRTKY